MPHQPAVRACLSRRSLVLLAVALLFLLVPLARVQAASEAPADSFAVSLTAAAAFADAGTAPAVSISDDGRRVAFVSAASNLSDAAPAGVAEVYVKDLDSGAVELASRADGEGGTAAEPEPIGEAPAGQIEDAMLSGNGRYLVFASQAHNLVPGLPLAAEEAAETFFDHVYRRDLATGETILVDRANGPAGSPVATRGRIAAISADGRYVLFGADVEDLENPVGAHDEGFETLYLRDLQAGTTVAVGRATDQGGDPGPLASEGSYDGDLSGDGRYVVFSSPSPNLDPGANGLFQVYRRDLQSGETVSASLTNATGSGGGELSDGEAFEPSFLDRSGCRVAFVAVAAANLFEGSGKVPAVATYVRDLCASPPTTRLVSLDEEGTPFEEGVLSGTEEGGGILLKAAPAGGASHLYLRDPGKGTTMLLDRAGGTLGTVADLGVELGAISANGCRAVFSSGASNLTPEAPPASGSAQQLQVYARQLAPCRPTAGEAPTEAPPGPPFSIDIALIGPRRLWLDFDAAATAAVQVQRSLGHGRRRLVRALQAHALGPETVRLRFRALPPGVYRFLIVPRVPGARRLSARLEVGSNTLGDHDHDGGTNLD